MFLKKYNIFFIFILILLVLSIIFINNKTEGMENQYSRNIPIIRRRPTTRPIPTRPIPTTIPTKGPTTRPRQTTPRQTTLVAPQLNYRIGHPGQVEELMQYCYKYVNDNYSSEPKLHSKLTGILNNYINEGGTQSLINTLHTFKNVLNSVNDNGLNTKIKDVLFMNVDMPDSFGRNS